jgi:hypothetical protein
MPENPWAALGNPGALGVLSARSLSVSCRPHTFGITELAQGGIMYVEPASVGTIGVAASRFGFSLYREVTFSLAFERTILQTVWAGGTLNYYSLTIERYGTGHALGLDLGVVAELRDGLFWGISALNVNGPTIGIEEERLPQVFWMSLIHQPVPHARFFADLVKDIRFPLEFRIGALYDFLGVLEARLGLSSEPRTHNAGVGIALGWIRLDYALSNHLDLGLTHEFSLSLQLGDP